MRRRQAFAEQTKSVGVIQDYEILGTVNFAKKWSSREKRGTPKGVCPNCGKHIGRGLHGHKKACK